MIEQRKYERRKPGRRASDEGPEVFTCDRRYEYRQRILAKYGIDINALGKEQNSLEMIREGK